MITGLDCAIVGAVRGARVQLLGTLSPPWPGAGHLLVHNGIEWLLLESGAPGQVLVADPGEVIGLKWVDDLDSWHFEIPEPAVGDEFLLKDLRYDVTFTECYYHVVTGSSSPTVSFDIIRRARSASGAGGTDITASPMQATETAASTTAFANNGAANADEWLIAKVTATGGTPNLLRVTLRHKRRV